ncbi:M3 family oligoendopeptidase [archaeon]|nr:M3 family oligoendopeptidase [archaeon]
MMKTEWNLNQLKEKDFQEERKLWKSKVKAFTDKYKKDNSYLTDPKELLKALNELEELERNYGTTPNELFYYWLKSEKNKNDPEIKAKYNQIEELSIEIANELQFFLLNLAKTENKDIFLNNKTLEPYKHFLETLFENEKYLLTDKEEKILNLKSQTSYSFWIDMVERFLTKEERIIKDKKRTYEELLSLMTGKDKELRDQAAIAFNDILNNNIDVAEAEINAILTNKKVNDKLRNFERPDKARHVADDIDTEVVDTLVQTVEENFQISRKYYELKAKLLKQDKLKYHERAVEYGDITKEYSYEDSINLTKKVFEKLDERFKELLDMFIKNEQIDVYPKKSKHGGAFCVYLLKSQPTFILLNHTNKLKDVLTIAHELGHAINNELIKEKQNSLNFGTPTSTAEVASTFMEDFVLQELLKDADDELKLTLLMQKLDSDINSIIRQIACYKFEQELHKNFKESGYLSKEEIGKLFQKNMRSYMGDFVEQTEDSKNWWVYWGHIRRFFYVYSYSSGLLISKAMQNLVKQDKNNIEKVKEFLAAGTSDSPKNIFKKIGIDITKKEFWETGLQEVKDLLQETQTLAKKLGKI